MTSSKDCFVSLFKASPLNDFLIPFRKAQNQWVARYIIILFAVIVRCAVGLGSYSGEGIGPMFGDFEAQRHWLEITIHLPITDWYYYDLQYWGLDYPPLTAFHSYIMGHIGSSIDQSWFSLDASRGIENPDLKTFMRVTSIISELIIYIPASIWYTKWMGRYYNNAPTIDQTIIAAAILFQPSLIIIDHGHFQYNSVMLGLALLSVVNLLYDQYALACVCFVLSLGFKQMALYYSPVIFCYLLSICIWPFPSNFNILRLISIGIATVSTFVFLFGPFVYAGGLDQLHQIILRIFPFNRGLFEDKVANFWCATNVIIKYRELFTTEQLKQLSLLLTLLGFIPSCIAIFLKPRKNLLAWCLISTSLSFYLFSFQVHEKSILLPLMPITLLLNEVNPDVISMVCWISNIALFSMWPLIKRDGLGLQYFVLGVMSNWLMGNLSWIRKWVSLLGLKKIVSSRDLAEVVLPHNLFWKLIIVGTYIGAGAIHALDFTVKPPTRLPDLWVIGNVVLSFCCFGLFFIWVNHKIYRIATTKVKTN